MNTSFVRNIDLTFKQSAKDIEQTNAIFSLIDALDNGTPIPDNATNGNVITEILKSSNDMHSTRNIGLAQEDTIYIEVGSNWWNAPYQKGGKE